MKPAAGAGLPFPISQNVTTPPGGRPALAPSERLVEELQPDDTVRNDSLMFVVDRVEHTGGTHVKVIDTQGREWEFLTGQIVRAWSPQKPRA